MSRRVVILFALFAATPLFAQVQYSITPNRGPVIGRTEVTINGPFSNRVSGVLFGDQYVPVGFLDGPTLRVTTWAHLPGSVDITLLEGETRIATGLRFTFEGKPEDAFEPMLLPIFMPPVAYGSEFRTEFQARVLDGAAAAIVGLQPRCSVPCSQPFDREWFLSREDPEIRVGDVDLNGTPGAFLYLLKTDYWPPVTMNLRVYDTSRAEENFGTEIPIVRMRDLAMRQQPLTLIGIPSDHRFRNTLRIYGYGGEAGADLIITITAENGGRRGYFEYLPTGSLFEPSYIEVANLPTDVGMLRITIEYIPPGISAPLPPPLWWAFVSVTNNETQQITLITPQP